MTLQFPPGTDEKKARILTAARSVFALYGFRRASMEDIAKAAAMSRAALYQHFRNKEDILTHGVDAFFDIAVHALEQALTPARPVAEALSDAFTASTGGLAEALLDSPHGEELLSMKAGAAEAETARGNARIAGVWAKWLAVEAEAGRLTLSGASPDQVAQAIIAGQHGQKMIATSYRDYVTRLELFASLMARSLAV
jgi:AcrR family transcriptional regulator